MKKRQNRLPFLRLLPALIHNAVEVPWVRGYRSFGSIRRKSSNRAIRQFTTQFGSALYCVDGKIGFCECRISWAFAGRVRPTRPSPCCSGTPALLHLAGTDAAHLQNRCAAMPPLPGPTTDSRRDSSARCHPKILEWLGLPSRAPPLAPAATADSIPFEWA